MGDVVGGYNRVRLCGKAAINYMEHEQKLIKSIENNEIGSAIDKLSEIESIFIPEISTACDIDFSDLENDFDMLRDEIHSNKYSAIKSILNLRDKIKDKMK